LIYDNAACTKLSNLRRIGVVNICW